MGVQFDLDPAHPPFATNVPCKTYYTQKENGLVEPWFGNVFMNPPFSKPAPWIDKFVKHRNGIALLVVSKSRRMNDLWENADGLVLLPSTLKFDQGTIFIATMLIAYGQHNVKAISNVGRVR